MEMPTKEDDEVVAKFIQSNAKKNCPKCYGTGNNGYKLNGLKIICDCVVRKLAKKKLQ